MLILVSLLEKWLKILNNIQMLMFNIIMRVIDFNHQKGGKWEVKIRQRNSGDVQTELADYVFIGAGGGAIPLLQKTGIPESKIWEDSQLQVNS